MHRIHQTRFYGLVKHDKSNGLSLHVHGHNKRLPSTTFSGNTIERVVKFIMNMTKEQALLLRGRVPGFKNNNHIHRVANLGEAEKAEVVRQQERHLQLAMGGRDYYKNCCKKSEALIEHLEDVEFSKKRAPCTFEGQVHYS